LVRCPERLHSIIRDLTGAAVTALAADYVTAHLGALGGRPGAVLSAGTGAVALGTDFKSIWTRADGWGHLIGDLGGGAWIGMTGLRAAAAALDGRSGIGGKALAERAVARLGPLETWPEQLYTVGDRAGRMAAFAADVANLAAAGDGPASRIMEQAAGLLAEALNAALLPGLGIRAAYAGGLFRLGEPLTGLFAAAFAQLAPEAELRASEGSPLDGAVTLAGRLAAGKTFHIHPPDLLIEWH
jgi:N-acetylglucosamine kinase-like BadF-type ATPase